METVLTQMSMAYALAVVLTIAVLAGALGLLTEPAILTGQAVHRAILRHRLGATRLPGMLSRHGLTLAAYCDDRTPDELRTALERCRTCPSKDKCQAVQTGAASGFTSYAFCPNRSSLAPS
ncbi:MAG TPA: DUF6455 family protein [Nevskiaceae bacterium]|nr:DUF6455 family protein [Nevskiaceae bacterium]